MVHREGREEREGGTGSDSIARLQLDLAGPSFRGDAPKMVFNA
jgi:hypothetical protein